MGIVIVGKLPNGIARHVKYWATAAAATLLLSGCGHVPSSTGAPSLAYAADEGQPAPLLKSPGSFGRLAGRTLRVSKISDINLRRGEVVLTFDDGPASGTTPAVLAGLRQAGVRATFFMLGDRAQANPALVRKVATDGHSIGTHTQSHRNLAGMSLAAATSEIATGQRNVAAALGPTGYRPAPFFRFPYLSSTAALRRQLAAQGVTVIDADVDSKDYFQSSPDQVRKRTMQRLAQRGSGVILLHDIHRRTATMLPSLLADLRSGGYKVVHLVPGNRSIGDGILMSSLGTTR